METFHYDSMISSSKTATWSSCLFHRSHGSSRKVGCDFPVYVVVCVVIWVITHVFLEVMREIYADINIKIVRQHLILYKFVDEH